MDGYQPKRASGDTKTPNTPFEQVSILTRLNTIALNQISLSLCLARLPLINEQMMK